MTDETIAIEGLELDSIVDDHTHHWMIGVQNGPTSEGSCRECGALRDFTNGFVRGKYMPLRRSIALPPVRPVA